MPNINITDSRKRDAVVKAENTGVHEEVRYVDSEGSVASTRKVLKATVAHDFDTLNKQFGDDPQKLGYALIEGDPEVDMERCGVYLWGVSKVYVTSDDGIVYRIEQTEKVLDTNGEIKETRPRRRAEANVDADIPLTWTGRKIKKSDAVQRFVFSSKLQVVHVNGLTYDFLYGMAKELETERSLMMVGGGSDGKDPLVFRRGSVPYRGFLEGRIDGEQYILLLHLSNMELKVPESVADASRQSDEAEVGVKKDSVVSKGTKDSKDTRDPHDKDRQKEKTGKQDQKADADDDQPSNKKESAATEALAGDSSGKKQSKSASKKASGKKTAAQKTSQEAKTGSDSSLNSDSDEGRPESAKEKKSAVAEPDAASESKVARSQNQMSEQTVDAEDLGVWLKSIRMGKYFDLFVANEIDVDILTELSDDDLKELDIPLGSRRRLLKAVEEADNLRAEVAMAVSKISRSSADTKSTAKASKKKRIKKKKSTTKKADK